jgi:hypothetical protein
VRYQFDLATPGDDAELREIIAATPMPGKISVTFRREPSFFAAAAVDGTFRQIIVCRDREANRIIGFGSRSGREMYVNGEPTPIGYLSGLRALEPYRGLGLLARGYKYFRDLHADGRAKLYLTTIAEGNERAISVLTTARAGLPRYHFAGKFLTVAIPIPRRRLVNGHGSAGLNVRCATRDDVGALLEFLHRVGPRRQFFPKYEARDFFGEAGTFKQLDPSNLLLAFRHGKIVGSLGGWDQRRFRQTIVERYDPAIRWARPVYNGWARLRRRPRLPAPGSPLDFVTAAVPVVEDDDRAVFSALMERLLRDLAGGDCQYLMIGLHETDALLPVVIERRAKSYETRLYYVVWEDGEVLRSQLDGRTPYLELGRL